MGLLGRSDRDDVGSDFFWLFFCALLKISVGWLVGWGYECT